FSMVCLFYGSKLVKNLGAIPGPIPFGNFPCGSQFTYIQVVPIPLSLPRGKVCLGPGTWVARIFSLDRSMCRFPGFDMDGDMGDLREPALDFILKPVGQDMPLLHTDLSIDHGVELNEIVHPGLSDKTLFSALYALHGMGDLPDLGDQIVIKVLIHDFPQGGAENPIAVIENKGGGQKGGPVIGHFIALPKDQGDGDPKEGDQGGDGIAPMVPGVRFQGGTANFISLVDHMAIGELFPQDDQGQYNQGPWGRGTMGNLDVDDALIGYDRGRGHQKGDH